MSRPKTRHWLMAMFDRLELQRSLSLTRLTEYSRCIDAADTKVPREFYERLASRILGVGEPILAYDVVIRGLRDWPDTIRLRQLQGLALARSGANDAANGIMRKLYREGYRDGETMGILARTYKDLWELDQCGKNARRCLNKAHQIYNQAYRLACRRDRLDAATYNGINAASTALLMDQEDTARKIAAKVDLLAARRLSMGDDYWALATRGEAALILGKMDKAAGFYARAVALLPGDIGSQSSTRRQARLLLKHTNRSVNLFDKCFRIPVVIPFAGHMIDQPGRKTPRFPPSLAQNVRKEIAARLKKYPLKVGYAGAACGSDLLFLEELKKQGGECNIVLPFRPEDFKRTSVGIIPNSDWGRKFDAIIRSREVRRTIADAYFGEGRRITAVEPVVYRYSNLILNGLARLRAQILDTEIVPLVVWDGRPGDGPWGTADTVAYWRGRGLHPDVIDISGFARKRKAARPTGKSVRHALASGHERQIVAMLYADVKQYSRLPEESIQVFTDGFLRFVTGLAKKCSRPPMIKDTWGDALMMVFCSVRDAGCFALELRDHFPRICRVQMQLQEEMQLRIALHVGLVRCMRDPLSGKTMCVGRHVVRVARLEPKTPPGQVYATQEFAALVAAEGVREFRCDYIGLTEFDKQFGTFPVYHVRRTAHGK